MMTAKAAAAATTKLAFAAEEVEIERLAGVGWVVRNCLFIFSEE
jgi:hypothetical protein